jgi:hypothetical protein
MSFLEFLTSSRLGAWVVMLLQVLVEVIDLWWHFAFDFGVCGNVKSSGSRLGENK